ncbi:MAG TPA: riboflavin synthase [Planctomycetota bacterium]|nr:riboflavin synthase [Planctomycetota bacterium]
MPLLYLERQSRVERTARSVKDRRPLAPFPRAKPVFTGLVEACSTVHRTAPRGTGLRIWVALPSDWTPQVGQSVCVSGACLSVAEATPEDLVFDLSDETLQRTWFADLRPGVRVNLERAMLLSDRLDGHLVSGHVDGRGRLAAIEDSGDGGRRITIEVEPGLERYLVEKGSIAVDGISLTVVDPRARRFDVAVIPITLEKTTLGRTESGAVVNLEADLIGKWIERLVPRPSRPSG